MDQRDRVRKTPTLGRQVSSSYTMAHDPLWDNAGQGHRIEFVSHLEPAGYDLMHAKTPIATTKFVRTCEHSAMTLGEELGQECQVRGLVSRRTAKRPEVK